MTRRAVSAPVCEAADCGQPVAGRAMFCPDHEHEWVAAGEVPLHPKQVGTALRRTGIAIPEETWVVVRDVYCQRCRQPYEQIRDLPCDSYATVLRGGPLGTRRKREAGGDGE